MKTYTDEQQPGVVLREEDLFATRPKRRNLFPFTILFALEAALLLAHAVLPLRGLWFHEALLTRLGSWPLWPTFILFPGWAVTPPLPGIDISGTPDIPLSWVETFMLLAALLVIFLLYLLALRRLPQQITHRYILWSTLLFGITCVLIPVVTSPDIFSYIAYARIGVIYHLNPLTTAPMAISTDPIFPHIYWIDQPSAYGPTWAVITSLLQWFVDLFGASSSILSMFLALRLLGLAMHLGSTYLVWSISGYLQRASGHISPHQRIAATLAFAWNPLLLFEACVNAHNDTTLLFLVLLAIWFLVRRAYTCSIMNFPDQDRQGVVPLSAAKGLSRWAERCFAALSMTGPVWIGKNHYRGAINRAPTARQGSARVAHVTTSRLPDLGSADKSALYSIQDRIHGPIMRFKKFTRICSGWSGADKSAVALITCPPGRVARPLRGDRPPSRYPGSFVKTHDWPFTPRTGGLIEGVLENGIPCGGPPRATARVAPTTHDRIPVPQTGGLIEGVLENGIPLQAVVILAIATCLKINIILLFPGFLLFLWAQQQEPLRQRIRRIALASAIYGSIILIFYAPFWQDGALLKVLQVNPTSYRNINTMAEFLSSLYDSLHHNIVVALGYTTSTSVPQVSDDFIHILSIGAFIFIYIWLCWRALRTPHQVNTLPRLIGWLALVWLLYCVIGAPWFWPWYIVIFFGLYSLIEATTKKQPTSLAVRLLAFSALSVYCFYAWGPHSTFIPGLPGFQWSFLRGLWLWLIPLLALRPQLNILTRR